MFLGAAALITAGVRGLGLESVPLSVLVWAVASLALVLPFRPLVQRLVPGRSVVRRDRTDVEGDRERMGEVVEVVEDVDDEGEQGRIRFQGTTWQARSTTGHFKRGEKVQLVYRQEAVWVVEAVGDGSARDLFVVPDAEASQPVQAAQSIDADAPARKR
jgi:membrane protein implicated in regulation of membrane protease activity